MLRLLALLLTRLVTTAPPRTTGVGVFADQLSGPAQATRELAAGRNATSYVFDPATGDAVAIWGYLEAAPINTNGKTPSFASTGLTGWGIASKQVPGHVGTWTQIG